jgi:tetratricopeptide (TPR) repeat protein
VNTCPSDQDLDDFLSGDAVGPVGEHLRGCAHCQEAVDRLSDDGDLRPTVATLADHVWEWDGDPTLASIVERLRRETPLPERHDPDIASFPIGPLLEASDHEEMLGRLGLYDVETEIGRGGMGIVFRARDRTTGRVVALKILHSRENDPKTRRRFIQEVRAAAKVEHDNVVRLYSTSAPEERVPYFAMEYLQGPNLAEMNHQRTRIDPRKAAAIVAQVGDGLQAAHLAGLVHSDVKPANILVDHVTGRAKIGDFGLARLAAEESQLTREGLMRGTPAYLSPEQARGELPPNARSDVYSLGVTLYECLAGEIPFRGEPHRIINQVLHDEPRPPRVFNDAIPRDLETICLKAMAKEPSKRYQTAMAFSDDLRRFLGGEPIQARPVSAFERLWRWCRNNRRIAWLSALAVSLLITLATGSTIAAVWIAREKSNAVEQARLAEVHRGLTLDAFNALIEGVQDKLATRPGTLELRRSLLEVARDGLGKVIREVPGEARTEIDGRTVTALIKLGDIDLILGQTAESRVWFDRASLLAERDSSEKPDSISLRRNLAAAFDRLGDIDHRQNLSKVVNGPYQRSYAIRLGLIAEHPEFPAIRRDLRVSQSKLADAYSASGDFGKARELLDDYLKALLQEPDDDENRLLRLNDRRFIYGRIGRLEQRLGRKAESIASLRKSYAAAETLCKLDPENAESRRQKAFALDYLGLACLKFGDLEEAEKALNEFKDDRASAFQADPENREVQRSLALSHQHLGALATRRDDFERAKSEYLQASRIFDEVATHDPSSVSAHKDRLIILRQLTDMETRRGHFEEAVTWLDRQLEIQAGKSVPPHPDQAGWIDEARFLREVFLLVPRAMKDPRSVGALPPNVENLLLKMRALTLARAGRVGEAAEAAKQLLSIPDTLGEALTAARTYAMIVKFLSQASPEERSRYIVASLEALKRAIDHDPSQATHLEFDELFESIKNEPGFRSLFARDPH